MRTIGLVLGIASSSLLMGIAAAETTHSIAQQDEAGSCMARKLAAASDSATIGELRAACATEASVTQAPLVKEPAAPVLTQRLAAERDTFNNRYAITPHHANYFLLASYAQHRPSNETFSSDGGANDHAQKVESKFQISFKVPLKLNAFNGAGDFFAGYTQRSFWQLYNRGASSPFRETNYEPEVWFSRTVNQPILNWNLSSFAVGVNHQSNGLGGDTSRSWNRVVGILSFEHAGFGVVLRPWWRIPERRESDNNPDITNYLGSFDLTLLGHYGDHVFDLMLRNNLKLQNNRGAMQLGWSFPLAPKLRAYAQWFYGYGESLIDYKVRQNTLGVGVQLLDW